MKKFNFTPFDFEVNPKDNSLREGTALSNMDGRLWNEVGEQAGRFFGDEAMVRARIGIEARYLIALSKSRVIRKFTKNETKILLTLHEKINPKVYDDLREIESKIHHDVVAMTEIFKKLLAGNKKLLRDITPWLHWALTTYDIDDTAKALLLKNFLHEIFIPHVTEVLKSIVNLSERTGNVVMTSKTHLQPAVPTLMGKEIALFGVRLAEITKKIADFKLKGKLTGAVGNLSAHKSAYPKINWLKFSKDFIESLDLEANLFTTQIDPKDSLVELLGLIEQVNLILVDLSQDMRLYIGFDLLSQQVKKEEVGSSAMPQKVNPIDFENSQGNAIFSNWILEGLRRQLPVSWLQRDLVDKTVLRNLGVPFGHTLIALVSANKGVSKVSPNIEKVKEDLEEDWSILAEAYQTNLRAFGMGDAYEKLKELSRGKKLNKLDIENWINDLEAGTKIKFKLQAISFKNYTGYAKENTRGMINKIDRTIKDIAKRHGN